MDKATLYNAHLLEAEECVEAVVAVHSLREQWTPRGGPGFCTLGVNCYQDLVASPDPESTYFVASRRTNRLLRDNFGWLLERVRSRIESEISRPVQFHDRLALPGFHIFLSSAIPATSSASIHLDYQYMALSGLLYDQERDPDPETISVTLPIALPTCGGGLNYWPLIDETGAAPEVRDSQSIGPPTGGSFHLYALGDLVLHSGKVLHQIAGVSPVTEADQRITLQGHGLLRDGVMWLYW